MKLTTVILELAWLGTLATAWLFLIVALWLADALGQDQASLHRFLFLCGAVTAGLLGIRIYRGVRRTRQG
jgi:hypothetical protein